jgi:hypothetical protein
VAAGSVLAVDHDEVGLVGFDQYGQGGAERLASRLTNDVAQK